MLNGLMAVIAINDLAERANRIIVRRFSIVSSGGSIVITATIATSGFNQQMTRSGA
jgi:hypothetical protein